jgi:hypothetical protein
MELDSKTCDVDRATYDWQALQPQIKRLVNCASEGNMSETVCRFKGLGFPWENSDILASFANLIAAASGGHGFYGECYAQLVWALCPHCGSEEHRQRLVAVVENALSEHLCKCVSELVSNDDPELVPRLKQRLVNTSNFAGSLIAGTSNVGFLNHVLCSLGLVRKCGSLQFLDSASNNIACPDLGAKVRVSMLSGACPTTQPIHGETVRQYRQRLACELGVSSDRVALLAGEALVSVDSCLDQTEGMLQLIIRDVSIAEEYRLEATKVLLLKAMPQLLASTFGKALLKQVLVYFDSIEEELPKRAKFMLMDIRAASMDAMITF